MSIFGPKKNKHVDPRMMPIYSYTDEKTGKVVRGFYSQVRGFEPLFDQRGAINVYDHEMKNDDGLVTGYSRRIQEARSKGYTPSDPIAIYKPGGHNFVGAGKAMQANFGWVYACIKAIADEMANTEFKLYTINKDGEHEEKLEHEVLDFLDMVNDFQTGPEFKHMIASHLELTGNCFIYLEGVKKYTDKPTAMYLLDPGKVKVVLDTTRYPFKIAYYLFIYAGREQKYEPEEIIQLKYPDPSNPYVGMGTVQGAAEWIDNDNH